MGLVEARKAHLVRVRVGVGVRVRVWVWVWVGVRVRLRRGRRVRVGVRVRVRVRFKMRRAGPPPECHEASDRAQATRREEKEARVPGRWWVVGSG